MNLRIKERNCFRIDHVRLRRYLVDWAVLHSDALHHKAEQVCLYPKSAIQFVGWVSQPDRSAGAG